MYPSLWYHTEYFHCSNITVILNELSFLQIFSVLMPNTINIIEHNSYNQYFLGCSIIFRNKRSPEAQQFRKFHCKEILAHEQQEEYTRKSLAALLAGEN